MRLGAGWRVANSYQASQLLALVCGQLDMVFLIHEDTPKVHYVYFWKYIRS
jgi:hypothetical protein